MTEQIAIHCLKSEIMLENCEECPKYGETGTDHCQEDAIRLAIEALEKQIPMKVIYHDNCGNETPNQSRCPKCHEAINDTWYWTGESWCPYCGQKLDWGD